MDVDTFVPLWYSIATASTVPKQPKISRMWSSFTFLQLDRMKQNEHRQIPNPQSRSIWNGLLRTTHKNHIELAYSFTSPLLGLRLRLWLLFWWEGTDHALTFSSFPQTWIGLKIGFLTLKSETILLTRVRSASWMRSRHFLRERASIWFKNKNRRHKTRVGNLGLKPR